MRKQKQLEKRWREIYHDYKEREVKLRSFYLNPEKNQSFFYTARLSTSLGTLGEFEYLLNRDVDMFKKYLTESTLIEQELFENFEKGLPVDPSYVAITTFWKMFKALATGNIDLAKNFARYNGGRFEIDQEHATPFAVNFGYTLKYFIEGTDKKSQKMCLEKLAADCKTEHYRPFRGYVTVFEALLENDSDKVNRGFEEIVVGHIEECNGKGDRYFYGIDDQDICLWGVGMANLAIHYGFTVSLNHPLIPRELLLKKA